MTRPSVHSAQSTPKSRNENCLDCNKSFTNKPDLDDHIREHEGYGKHPCPLCEAQFTRKRDIKRHLTNSCKKLAKPRRGRKPLANRNNFDPNVERNEEKLVPVQAESNEIILSASLDNTMEIEMKLTSEEENTDKESQFEQMEDDTEPAGNEPQKLQVKMEESLAETLLSKPVIVKGEPVVSEEASNTATEHTVLPITAAIYKYSAIFKEENMLIWEHDITQDLALAVSDNADRSLLMLKDSEDFPKTAKMFAILQKYDIKKASFSLMVNDGCATQWSMISFGPRLMPFQLSNKLFKSYREIEEAVKSSFNLNSLRNVIKFSDADFFRDIKTQLVNPSLFCSSEEKKS